MKRIATILLSLLLCVVLVGCLADISLLYDCTEFENFYIGVNYTANCCFVGGYNCTEYTPNFEITIPDKYNGVPITRIGGYFCRGVPTPFDIQPPDSYMNAPEDSEYFGIFHGDIHEFEFDDDYTVVDMPFTLNIGKNIKKIDYVAMDSYYPYLNEDGSVTFYHPVVNINCSEDNKHFFSHGGRLYSKGTQELIKDFEYALYIDSEIGTFSYANILADFAGVPENAFLQRDDFKNTEPVQLDGIEQIVERAKRDCTENFDGAFVNYDSKAKIYEIDFSLNNLMTDGGGQTIYISEDGITLLAIRGE